jgi:prolyl-tRNA synthetase
MLERARQFMSDNTREVSDYEEFKEIMNGPRGFIVAPWCGEEGPELDRVQDETSATVRCILPDREPGGPCIFTGKPATCLAVFAKAY